MDIVEGEARAMFIEVPYRFETGEAERIAVDYVAKTSATVAHSEGSSTLVPHLTSQRNAIKMLHSRIEFLAGYLAGVKDGSIPTDHDALRQISGLCARLPIVDSQDFAQEYMTEYSDVLLTMYLATVTKGTNAMNELVEKFLASSAGRGVGKAKPQTWTY